SLVGHEQLAERFPVPGGYVVVDLCRSRHDSPADRVTHSEFPGIESGDGEPGEKFTNGVRIEVIAN
ncbi:MAG: hypothetical protein JWQ78_1807, partial [Sediminibacterium sp.]|nr:hypothetical protein [Sediminibacterium sp.]